MEQQNKTRHVKCADKDCTLGLVDLNDMFVAVTRPVLQADATGKQHIVGSMQMFFHVECYYKKHPMQYGAEA